VVVVVVVVAEAAAVIVVTIVGIVLKHHFMETYGEMDINLHSFLTSPLNIEVSDELHASAALPRGGEAPAPIV
jgi:hypothetical protein